MNMRDIQNIFKLMKEKEYDDIYEKYGNIPYNILAPQWYKEVDVEELLEEKNYRKLYEKYGPNIFDEYIERRKSDYILKKLHISRKSLDILSIERNLRKMFEKICLIGFSLGTTLALSYFGFAAFTLVVGIGRFDLFSVNAKAYEKEITEYNLEIDEYADYMNSLGLTDLEIIQKYIYDMHSNIEYSESEEYAIIPGYERLALFCDGVGVCRNMADDFAARMNAINPEYQVSTIACYIGDESGYFEYLSLKDAYQSIGHFLDASLDYVIMEGLGNHVVSCVKLDDGTILVVDVTNSWIGVLEDGKIKIFDEYYEQNLEIDIKFLGNLSYLPGFGNYIKVMLGSYMMDVDVASLEEKYGEDAQEIVLDSIKEKYDTEHYGTQKTKKY